MVIKKAALETVLGVKSALPAASLPEVAFAGRSNAGKSSLINGLLMRNSYARVSSHPGKTRTINYYNVNDSVYIVDLPGYGYAQAPPAEKAAWGKMIDRYLSGSAMLRMVFLLVDMRHAPSANDQQMYRWIYENGFDPAIICTKSDKLKRSAKAAQLALIRKSFSLPQETPVIAWSAKTKEGREEIWELIEEYVIKSR